jgi:hypothetical protein
MRGDWRDRGLCLGRREDGHGPSLLVLSRRVRALRNYGTVAMNADYTKPGILNHLLPAIEEAKEAA